jgi:hypothetical protein
MKDSVGKGPEDRSTRCDARRRPKGRAGSNPKYSYGNHADIHLCGDTLAMCFRYFIKLLTRRIARVRHLMREPTLARTFSKCASDEYRV